MCIPSNTRYVLIWCNTSLQCVSTDWVLMRSEEMKKVFKGKTYYYCFYTYSRGVCGTTNNKEVKPIATKHKR